MAERDDKYCVECGQERLPARPSWLDLGVWRWLCRFTEYSRWMWWVVAGGFGLGLLQDWGYNPLDGLELPADWGAEEWLMVGAGLYLIATIPAWLLRFVAWCCWRWERRRQ